MIFKIQKVFLEKSMDRKKILKNFKNFKKKKKNILKIFKKKIRWFENSKKTFENHKIINHINSII